MADYPCLPKQLYRAEQVRALDRYAIDVCAIPGIRLMRCAGQFTFEQLLKRWPEARALSIWCGRGNNGGDGYIVAGLARQHGLAVQLVQLGDEAELQGDAARACQWAKACGVELTPWDERGERVEIAGDVIVDALLGTGLRQVVRAPYDRAIACINRAAVPVMAVDIPSGLCADTGSVLGVAVRAACTCTFIGLKQGLFTAQGPAYSGAVLFDGLGVPAEVYPQVVATAQRLDRAFVPQYFGLRCRDAHKGHFGHVLVVGGELGMGGAVIMAAQAAARVGAGLVSVATRPEHVTALLARCPEVMVHGITESCELDALLANKTALIVGPGLGVDAWGRELLQTVLHSELPTVVDADALNLLAEQGQQKHNHWILTPHPGEAARLLGCRVAEVQADRFAAVRALQARYGGVVLLKGLGSLVVGPAQGCAVCTAGNPGMASGGMGDVLSGVLGGLLAQGFEQELAAQLGMVLHAVAADSAAEKGERGLLATDLLCYLRRLVNPTQRSLEFGA